MNVYSAASLILWSLLTIGSFAMARGLYLRTRSPLLHPGLMGIFGVVALLELTGHDYAAYWRETAWINWLLGPAVVAMAVPIYQLRALVRANLRALLWWWRRGWPWRSSAWR